MFIEIRDKNTNKLLFKYDPVRKLIEIKVKDMLVLVDLTEYEPQPTGLHGENIFTA